jgi:hypothetical protein
MIVHKKAVVLYFVERGAVIVEGSGLAIKSRCMLLSPIHQ